MGVGGIGGNVGHIGVSAADRRASTSSNAFGSVFEVLGTGAGVAASTFAGPAAGAAVGGLARGIGGSSNPAVGNSPQINQTLGALGQQADNNALNTIDQQRQLQNENMSQQLAFFGLQRSVQKDSETFQTVTNLEKKAADARNTAVNNLR